MKDIEKVNINEIKKSKIVDYVDGDIFMIKNIPTFSKKNKVFNFDFIAIIVCYSGYIKGELNSVPYKLEAGDILMCKPNSTVFTTEKSKDAKVGLLGFSFQTLDASLYSAKDLWELELYITTHPFLHMKNIEDRKLFAIYEKLVYHKSQYHSNKFHKEIIRCLLYCVLFELLSIISQQEDVHQITITNISQSEIIFRKFIQKLMLEDGRIHSVKEVASALNITPKYLSSIVKSISGKTAMMWIHEYMVKSIEKHLKYTTMSIKEVAISLNFENLSFFGKFTKNHLGCSPKEYRKKVSE
ncbi:MAG: AraC family transcriptional regulator [Bacteroidales bacterium]|nr:AraC family transcriptional regulator [Bacteroidales bacterium]